MERRRVDLLDVRMVEAVANGIMAGQRSRPDPKLVCRDALDIGLRLAIGLRDPKRYERIRRAIKQR